MKGAPAFSLSRRTASILRNVRKLPFCFFSSSNVMYCMNILPITAATKRQPHEIKQQIFLKQPTLRAQSGPCRPTGGPPKNATQTGHRRTQVASGRHTDRPRAALEPRGLCKLCGHRRPQSPPSQWRRPLCAPPGSPCICSKTTKVTNDCLGPKPRATINKHKLVTTPVQPAQSAQSDTADTVHSV